MSDVNDKPDDKSWDLTRSLNPSQPASKICFVKLPSRQNSDKTLSHSCSRYFSTCPKCDFGQAYVALCIAYGAHFWASPLSLQGLVSSSFASSFSPGSPGTPHMSPKHNLSLKVPRRRHLDAAMVTKHCSVICARLDDGPSITSPRVFLAFCTDVAESHRGVHLSLHPFSCLDGNSLPSRQYLWKCYVGSYIA